jgi:hypothetical protein
MKYFYGIDAPLMTPSPKRRAKRSLSTTIQRRPAPTVLLFPLPLKGISNAKATSPPERLISGIYVFPPGPKVPTPDWLTAFRQWQRGIRHSTPQ